MLEDVYQSFIDYNSKVIASRYDELNLNEIHSINFIGKSELPNVTKIASHLKIPKGAVTKIAAKLIRLDFVEAFQDEPNKKEKYFRFTAAGQEMFKRHDLFHNETVKHAIGMYKKFDKDAFEVVSRFLQLIQNDFNEKLKITGE